MDLKISDILDMQTRLQKHYEGKWNPLTPQQGTMQLLWTLCEMGEVVDIIKKKGEDAVMDDPRVRASFTEELADVMMYLGDILLCFGISADEISRAFTEKHEYNMHREYKGVAHFEKDDDGE
jgi:NTP pyrophosphatase (non-canonical NTP hydrolase)